MNETQKQELEELRNKLIKAAHNWSIETYMKGLGRPCDIDGARCTFQELLTEQLTELITLREENTRLSRALQEIKEKK